MAQKYKRKQKLAGEIDVIVATPGQRLTPIMPPSAGGEVMVVLERDGDGRPKEIIVYPSQGAFNAAWDIG